MANHSVNGRRYKSLARFFERADRARAGANPDAWVPDAGAAPLQTPHADDRVPSPSSGAVWSESEGAGVGLWEKVLRSLSEFRYVSYVPLSNEVIRRLNQLGGSARPFAGHGLSDLMELTRPSYASFESMPSRLHPQVHEVRLRGIEQLVDLLLEGADQAALPAIWEPLLHRVAAGLHLLERSGDLTLSSVGSTLHQRLLSSNAFEANAVEQAFTRARREMEVQNAPILNERVSAGSPSIEPVWLRSEVERELQSLQTWDSRSPFIPALRTAMDVLTSWPQAADPSEVPSLTEAQRYALLLAAEAFEVRVMPGSEESRELLSEGLRRLESDVRTAALRAKDRINFEVLGTLLANCWKVSVPNGAQNPNQMTALKLLDRVGTPSGNPLAGIGFDLLADIRGGSDLGRSIDLRRYQLGPLSQIAQVLADSIGEPERKAIVRPLLRFLAPTVELLCRSESDVLQKVGQGLKERVPEVGLFETEGQRGALRLRPLEAAPVNSEWEVNDLQKRVLDLATLGGDDSSGLLQEASEFLFDAVPSSGDLNDVSSLPPLTGTQRYALHLVGEGLQSFAQRLGQSPLARDTLLEQLSTVYGRQDADAIVKRLANQDGGIALMVLADRAPSLEQKGP